MARRKWRSREAASVREVVERNTGLKASEFLAIPDHLPFIYRMDEFVKAVEDLVSKEKRIDIIADYDCDGLCSGWIMWNAIKRVLEKHNADPDLLHIHFPHRFTEGYGMPIKYVESLPDSGAIITVDNGISAVEQIEAANRKGITVLVTDHHLKREDGKLPDAAVIVDPAAEDRSEFHALCGAGVAYVAATYLCSDDERFLRHALAFASIATVADVMPLVSFNRKILIDGLKVMNSKQVPMGLAAIMTALKLDVITEEDYGFLLGPVFNASGRLLDDGAQRVFELLKLDASIYDPVSEYENIFDEAREKAKDLIEVNKQRQELKRATVDLCKKAIESGEYAGKTRPDKKSYVIFHEDFHEGINGIDAGAIAEDYGRIGIVFSRSYKDPKILKGSGRTACGVHLKNLLDQCSSYLLGYGGHAGAAGLAVREENLDAFADALEDALKDVSMDEGDYLWYDMEISERDIPACISELRAYAPFGEGNPAPIFKIAGFEATPVNGAVFLLMGNHKDHIKLFGRNELSAVGFGMAPLYEELKEPTRLDIVGTLSQNVFRGKVRDQIDMIDFVSAEREIDKTPVYRSLEDLLVF